MFVPNRYFSMFKKQKLTTLSIVVIPIFIGIVSFIYYTFFSTYIRVERYQPVGNMIMVKQLKLAKGGYIAVFPSTIYNKPGRLIVFSSEYLPAGTYTGVTLPFQSINNTIHSPTQDMLYRRFNFTKTQEHAYEYIPKSGDKLFIMLYKPNKTTTDRINPQFIRADMEPINSQYSYPLQAEVILK